jgi:hypothetical protein
VILAAEPALVDVTTFVAEPPRTGGEKAVAGAFSRATKGLI